MIKVFHLLMEVAGWILIFLSPALAGFVVGYFLYDPNDELFEYIGITLMILGPVVGVVWATRVWIKTGTMEYISRTHYTPPPES